MTEAASLLLQNGYAGFSMRRLAERIGYSVMTIYRYFENKEELIGAVLQSGFARFETDLARAAAGDATPRERIRRIGIAYVTFGLDNPILYHLMFMQAPGAIPGGLHGVPDRTHPERPTGFVASMFAVLDAWIASGESRIKDVDLLGHVLWSAVHGVVALGIGAMDHTREEMLEIGRETIDTTLRGIDVIAT
ncbi:MAG: TetR/AcrR family transcriptional regulator [Candidatus Eisenbacteria bacterium]|uniref:TetR/AcrR family transcriptional regulator n=1 Tax=Eiseniibacteriota bacterium TaxID=2212470 RepID=A0A956RP15_UNCEI|nr:TetR/AcrR family transcriptional regulator [Candidatus Eisenbacteria bacterium]